MSAMTLTFDLTTSLYKPALEQNKFFIFHTLFQETFYSKRLKFIFPNFDIIDTICIGKLKTICYKKRSFGLLFWRSWTRDFDWFWHWLSINVENTDFRLTIIPLIVLKTCLQPSPSTFTTGEKPFFSGQSVQWPIAQHTTWASDNKHI